MGSSPPLPPDPGSGSGAVRVAGRYILRRKLGSGSVGAVYLAQDAARGEDVALKLIRTERLSASAARGMQQEFRAISSLEHRQIASAYDFGYTEEGLPYYTREYIPGVPLPSGPPENEEPRRFLAPIIDLLDALQYLHAGGVLHLDIHAGNLIVSSDAGRGGVLIDFGFVRSAGDLRYALTASGWPDVPPELLEGEVAPSTDLFFVGSLLHYRLTGRAGGEVRLPREIPGWGARLTLDLERITTKALQSVPAQRFQSALEFREALAQVLGEREPPRACVRPRGSVVGRDRELGIIEEKLRAVAAGRPALLALCGPGGLGKTRLLEETRLRAQLRGFEVVAIQGMQAAGRGPLLLQALRRSRPDALRPPRSQSFRWLEPLDARHGGTPMERARRMADAYFLDTGPALVLLIDDFDGIDRESRVMVEALVSVSGERGRRNVAGRGLAVFLAAETVSADDLAREDVCHLRPLKKDDARRLFRDLLAPLEVPRTLVEDVVSRVGGVPLRAARMAGAVREEWERRGAIPDRLGFLDQARVESAVEKREWRGLPPLERRIVDTLTWIDRPTRLAELAVALDAPAATVGAALRRLRRAEVVSVFKQGRTSSYRLQASCASPAVEGETSSRLDARRVHERMAAYLESASNRTPGEDENLARHLLAADRVAEGSRVALRAATALRRQGSWDRAYRLLRGASEREESLEMRLRLAETMSEIAQEAGDHSAGIEAIQPLYRELDRLPAREATRMRRCLGIHYHRSGQAAKALEVFEGAQSLEDTRRGLEDAIFIDSELAEIYTLRAQYEEAETACRRGLERLESVAAGDPFRVRMEVTLRASLGHLEMRRMRLERARSELTTALKACRREGRAADLASILNNLGITANQQNDFAAARRYFREAERLLLAAGERRGTIKVAANLAIIDAKLGDRDQAEQHLTSAEQLLPYYRDRRLEFFVAYSRGVVSLLIGDPRAAIDALERALPLGNELGDHHMVQYGEVYLAEAELAAGAYEKASRTLKDASRRAEAGGGPLLLRMVHSRIFLLETLLGRARLAKRSRHHVQRTPRTDVEVLEAWNDVYYGLALALSGAAAGDRFDAALGTFARLGIPFGEQLVRVALLAVRLASGETTGIRDLLRPLDRDVCSRHRFLAVALPLARAEACFGSRDLDVADRSLAEASGAIVGSPFLELDWRIELMRSRLAAERGYLEDARRHLHRSLHTRDLLLQYVPSKARERFLGHSRFEALAAIEARLRKSPQLVYTTARLGRALSYEGMVGRSTAMRRLFQLVEKVADQELIVLLRGETGTGKELLARAIHRRSARREGTFLAIHCGSLPGDLFESELFGAVAGAYTGADEDRAGLLETASGGTLLFDEIGQLPLDAQGKLLQVLDSKSFRRLGSVEPRHADARILAATSDDLAARVSEGRFRADLYYRLSALSLELPPLRERASDIPELARYLAERHARRLGRPLPVIGRDALAALREFDWPGNVRQLEGVLLRAMLSVSAAESIRREDLAICLETGSAPASGEGGRLFDETLVERHDLQQLKVELERQYLTQTFLNCRGDAKLMMRKLGVKRTRLYTWFRRLGLDVRELRKRLGR